MASIQLGQAVVFGNILGLAVDTATSEAGPWTAKGVIVTSIQYERSSAIDETVDADGDVAQVTFHGFRSVANIECYPYSETSQATAVTYNVLPAIGDIIRLTSSTPDTDMSASGAGMMYTITRASKTRANGVKVMWNLECTKYGKAENDFNFGQIA